MERLEQHGESLAAAQTGHAAAADRASDPAVGSRTTAASCCAPYRALAEAIKDERSITPAAEWLVDNFHIVEEQLREIRDDLPADYYRELPKLADGPPRGLPSGPRPGLGVRRPHRQPLRPRQPPSPGGRLPAGASR